MPGTRRGLMHKLRRYSNPRLATRTDSTAAHLHPKFQDNTQLLLHSKAPRHTGVHTL